MSIGKYTLYGLGGFFAVGMVAMPFMPKPTPEQDMASGARYFVQDCNRLTRNRQINGSFGRGHVYCKCMEEALPAGMRTGDEYRFASEIHNAAGAERVFFAESRMRIHMDMARKQFETSVDPRRMAEVTRFLFTHAKACSRSV